jgi:hypothetical protein
VLSGGHGTFFGDQPRASEKYRKHLEGAGLIAPASSFSEAVKQAKALQEKKAAAARTFLLKERTGMRQEGGRSLGSFATAAVGVSGMQGTGAGAGGGRVSGLSRVVSMEEAVF